MAGGQDAVSGIPPPQQEMGEPVSFAPRYDAGLAHDPSSLQLAGRADDAGYGQPDLGSGVAPEQQAMDDPYADADPGHRPPGAAQKVRKSMRASEKYSYKPTITRLHVLELATQKEWWAYGQTALGFTLVLWIIFVYIMFARAGISDSYDLHLSVANHMEQIVAHPHLSGVRVRPVVEDPLPCRCACQSSSMGMPRGPCDTSASETLFFLGQLPAGSGRMTNFNTQSLISENVDPAVLGDKLGAGNDDIEPITWEKITEPEHVWFWVEHGFIPDILRQRSQDGGNVSLQGLVAQKNLIIGGVRARQDRAKWSSTCEDKITPELAAFYNTDCRSTESATAAYGPIGRWANDSSPAFLPSLTSETEGYYDELFDTELNVSTALDTATICRKQGWIDGATRSINLQSVTLNAEIGMFAIINIEFEFPAGGGVEKKVKVHTIHAVGSKMEFTDIIPELLWACLILLLLRQEITQMVWSGFERRCLDYWLDMWCVVDWVSIITAILIAVFWFWNMGSIGGISDSVAALPRAPFASGEVDDINAYRLQWQKILDASFDVFYRKQYYQLAMFWYTLILTSRFLKGFLSQQKLAMIQLTIGTVFWDLCHLGIFFCMLFLNFQLAGHVLFGAELEEWSTMVKAGASCVRFMLGNYHFDDIYEVAPFAATAWFWCFLISMSFVILNLIFSMVADYFHVVRTEIGDTDSLWLDTKNAVIDLWWRIGWRKINVQDGEFKAALLEHPYQDVVEGLMEVSEVPQSMIRNNKHTCLGVRVGRRHMEALSIEPLTGEQNKGFADCTSKGLQELGPDIMGAERLLELTLPHVELETKHRNESRNHLTMMRHFVTMLRDHHKNLDEHCEALEAEATVDHSKLARNFEEMEVSVMNCLGELDRLKDEGVHSLAPPILALPRPGTLAAGQAQKSSMTASGELLRAIDVQQSPEGKKKSASPSKPVPIKNIENAMLMNSNPSPTMLALCQKMAEESLGINVDKKVGLDGREPTKVRFEQSNEPPPLAIGNSVSNILDQDNYGLQGDQEQLPLMDNAAPGALPDQSEDQPSSAALAIEDNNAANPRS